MKKIFKYIFVLAAVSLLAPAVAHAQAMDPQSPVDTVLNGLHLSVQPFYDPSTQSGKFRVESFVEGSITVSTELPPLDILFAVAGHSNMGASWNSSSMVAVISDLVGGSGGFMDQLNAQIEAQGGTADVRYGLVTFGSNMSNAYTSGGWTTQSAISSKLASMAVNNSEVSCASSDPGNGMDAAVDFIDTYHTDEDESDGRQTVLIFITDGEGATPNTLVSKAYALKQQNVTVASILVKYTKGGHSTTTTDQTYMMYSSSDYPDAATSSSPGSQIDEPAFYSYVSSSAELANFFTALAQEVAKGGSTIEVADKSYVRAAFTPSFSVPAEHTKTDVFRAPLVSIDDTKPTTDPGHFTFGDQEDISSSMTITEIDNVVEISGFNYGYNFCGKKAGVVHGYKLITEIYFQMNNTLGPDVPVFDPSESGFYDDEGNKLLSFPKCNVHLAAIKVVKEGLKTGETVMYQLYDKDNNLISTFMIKGASNDGSADSVQKVVILSLIPTNNYTVKEISDWRWSYNGISTTSVTHPVVIGEYTEFRFGAATAKTDMPKNAENGKLNVLIPPSGIKADPGVDPLKPGGNYKMKF